MPYKRTAGALVVLLAVLGAAWGLVVFVSPQEGPPQMAVVPYSGKQLAVHYSFKSGVASYSGVVPLASACDSISSGISVAGTSSPRVTLTIDTLRPSTPCSLQGGASQDFMTALSSAAGAREPVLVAVILNGAPARYSIVTN